MGENKIIYAIAVVAMLALIGRILINKNKNGDKIGWSKLLAIFTAVIAFVVTFMVFEPHRMIQYIKGPATLKEGETECICGRKAGTDIARFTSSKDIQNEVYYALRVKELTETGYFRTKKPYTGIVEIDRQEQQTETDKTIISHKTNLFPITKNPGERINQYMPIYMATLTNDGKVLVCMEKADSQIGELPIAIIRDTDEKLANIASSVDSTAINEYYFVAFDESRYARNTTTDYIYKGIASLSATIIIALIYLFYSISKKRKKQYKK